MHNVFIQSRKDKKHTWWLLPYIVGVDYLLAGVQKWSDAWMEPTMERVNIPILPVKDIGASRIQPPLT